jgi:hypothetical protein
MSKAMATQYTPEEIETLARKRAGAKMGWFIHATVYVAVNLYWLLASSMFGYGSRPWSMAPSLGWGFGLVLHGLSVFVLGRGSGLRERMVQKERERLLREQNREP